jgi:hypothetical protein
MLVSVIITYFYIFGKCFFEFYAIITKTKDFFWKAKRSAKQIASALSFLQKENTCKKGKNIL